MSTGLGQRLEHAEEVATRALVLGFFDAGRVLRRVDSALREAVNGPHVDPLSALLPRQRTSSEDSPAA